MSVYVKPPAEWHRLASGARSTALVALAPEVDDALREVGKWLNEQPNRPIDRVAVAVLCAALSCSTAAQPAVEEFWWLVELFEPEGNSIGFYHTGFTDLAGYSRTTKAPHEAKRYSKANAEFVASQLFSKAGVWKAVEHGFATIAAAQPVEQPSTMHDTTGTQALWPQMIAALAAIDAELGLPEDGCNSLTQTLAAIRKLKAAPPAASGDSTPPSEPAGLTDDRIKRHTLRAADCPPDSKVLLVSSVRRFLAAQGDPSGALRPEPEAAGQGRWQPIETAPRGYSPPLSPINHHAPSILGLWGQAFYCVCSWGGPGKPMWIGEDNRPIPFQPTHWQPLPEPPQAASGSRGD